MKCKRILNVVEFLQNKYGVNNIVLGDPWESEDEAIGLTDKTSHYLQESFACSN